MTLTFYIARRFLTSVGQVFAVFFGILMPVSYTHLTLPTSDLV